MVEIMGKYGEKIEHIKEEVVPKLEEKIYNQFKFLETPSKSFESKFSELVKLMTRRCDTQREPIPLLSQIQSIDRDETLH
jgi:hypothetical protein